MIEFRTGDILQINAEALVNAVTCVGLMDRGVGPQFKRAFPDNFRAYKAACAREEVQPGRLFLFETGFIGNPKFIVNFPTRRHWKGKSRMEDIESGLAALAQLIKDRQIRSVALPPLVSGLGDPRWTDVRRLIEEVVKTLPGVQVIVFEPADDVSQGAAGARPARLPKMTAGRAALLALMRRYVSGLLDPFVTVTEVHKLMYFMQETGEPLRLRYVQAPSGPHAENLGHLLAEMDGHYIGGFGDGSEQPGKELSLVPGAADEALSYLGDHPDAAARFQRVADLMEGFESPFGLELLATVHWVLRHSVGHAPEEIRRGVYAWAARKKQFTPRQIDLATKVLSKQNWL